MPCPRTQHHLSQLGIKPAAFWLIAGFPNRSAIWFPFLQWPHHRNILTTLKITHLCMLQFLYVPSSLSLGFFLWRQKGNFIVWLLAVLPWTPGRIASAYAGANGDPNKTNKQYIPILFSLTFPSCTAYLSKRLRGLCTCTCPQITCLPPLPRTSLSRNFPPVCICNCSLCFSCSFPHSLPPCDV